MRVNRIFVERPLAEGARVELDRATAHHVTRVLRLEQRATLILFNGEGGEYHARITARSAGKVTVQALRFAAAERESFLSLHLVLGVSRAGRMDLAIQKAVELGATAIVPVLAARSVVRLDAAHGARRAAHWRKVIVSACEQCGRTRVPRLAPPSPFAEWLDGDIPTGLKLLADPHAGREPPPLPGEAREVTLLVGPEGGLGDPEVRAARAAGFIPVSFGPRTLRAETTAIAGLALIQARWGDLASWS